MSDQSRCEHINFVVRHDVHRLSRTTDGPVEVFTLEGEVICYDCGLQFAPFRIKLEPTGKIGANRPQLMPSPGLHVAGEKGKAH